jgi:hypothetical protein
MKTKKWKKVRRSKWLFPTRLVKESQAKGHIEYGERMAIANIERTLDGKLNYTKTAHTTTQWVFCVERNGSFAK